MKRPDFAGSLDEAHARIERDGLIEHRVGSLEAEPQCGADSLAEVLVSARRVPDRVVVRIRVGEQADGDGFNETAFRDYCGAQAESAWRRVTTIRRAGMRQLAPSLIAAAIVATVAVGCGTLAQGTGTHVIEALLAAIAGVCVIAAWVIVWMPIEEMLFDWRPDRRTATAYALLARSRLEIVAPGPAADARHPHNGDSARPARAARTEITMDEEGSHV